jgi:hypothetical protein
MTPLAKKVFALFGKPERVTEPKSKSEEVCPSAGLTPAQRGFLSRPLGQENNPDPWDAWGPFLRWLRERDEERFSRIYEAGDAITALERQGVTEGEAYDAACADLRCVFEEARRLRMREGLKVWIQ